MDPAAPRRRRPSTRSSRGSTSRSRTSRSRQSAARRWPPRSPTSPRWARAGRGLRLARGARVARARTTSCESPTGMAEVAAREGVTVAGGDVTRAPVLTLTVACVGYERREPRLVTRAGRGAGDVLAVTGELGGAAGALALTRSRGRSRRASTTPGRASPPGGRSPTPGPRDDRRQRRPRRRRRPPGQGERRRAQRSSSTCCLSARAWPTPSARPRRASSPREAARTSSCWPRSRRSLRGSGGGVEALGERLTQVGRVVQGEGVSIRDAAGTEVEPRGFDHMRGSGSG